MQRAVRGEEAMAASKELALKVIQGPSSSIIAVNRYS